MSSRFSYQPRPVSFLELWQPSNWQMKVYGIAYGPPRPEQPLVTIAKSLAEPLLESAREHYGVGFMGIHQGKTAHFIFVDWWARENELNHHVFTSTLERPKQFSDETAGGVMACVWDLAVIQFERAAWIDTVLKTGGREGFGAYLSRRLEGEV